MERQSIGGEEPLVHHSKGSPEGKGGTEQVLENTSSNNASERENENPTREAWREVKETCEQTADGPTAEE
jgi:hypothetical protein